MDDKSNLKAMETSLVDYTDTYRELSCLQFNGSCESSKQAFEALLKDRYKLDDDKSIFLFIDHDDGYIRAAHEESNGKFKKLVDLKGGERHVIVPSEQPLVKSDSTVDFFSTKGYDEMSGNSALADVETGEVIILFKSWENINENAPIFSHVIAKDELFYSEPNPSTFDDDSVADSNLKIDGHRVMYGEHEVLEKKYKIHSFCQSSETTVH